MRFLIKIPIPTPAENPSIDATDFSEKLQRAYRQVGALANYSRTEDGRRVDYVLTDLQPDRITPSAEILFRLLGVKSEFLPEIVPTPFYGRSGY